MRRPGRLLLVLLSFAPASAVAQRLPYGLRAGRHAVTGGEGRTAGGDVMRVWFPAAQDSVGLPRLLLIDGRAESPDTVAAVYLASHGYVVAMALSGAVPDTGWSLRIELHPSAALLRIAVGGQRITVTGPPGSSEPIRLRAALVHAAAVALLSDPPAVRDFARRVQATGLAVLVVPEIR